MIKGVTVQLIQKTQTGVDPFNAPVYEEEMVDVENVLVGEPTSDEITNTVNLVGKKVAYVLGIPKGDTHIWTDTEVMLPAPFAGRYRTIGFPTTGIEENIPLEWNMKVQVERIG